MRTTRWGSAGSLRQFCRGSYRYLDHQLSGWPSNSGPIYSRPYSVKRTWDGAPSPHADSSPRCASASAGSGFIKCPFESGTPNYRSAVVKAWWSGRSEWRISRGQSGWSAGTRRPAAPPLRWCCSSRYKAAFSRPSPPWTDWRLCSPTTLSWN